jgi:fumarate hydratase subunit alpha
MRIIEAEKITEVVSNLCLKANYSLPSDVIKKLRLAYRKELDKKAKSALAAIIKNAQVAKKEKLAICQDTGFPIVFVEIGQEVKIKGDLKKAINRGVIKGYKKGNFRESIIQNPLIRKNPVYSGAIIHIDIVKGKNIKITVMPKGFGCENKSILKMFLPTATIEEIKEFIVDAVKSVGPDACPPYMVGVGIGGTAEVASLLAKKALIREKGSLSKENGAGLFLEKDLLSRINKLKIGPMGLGGRTTALTVNIKTYPTHIAGLPVAVNLSCHALRSATAIL